MKTLTRPQTSEQTKVPKLPDLHDGGGGFDDIFNDNGGEGDSIHEFIMTVKTTRRMSVLEFDGRFKSSGRYELANLTGVGDALRIYCVSKNRKEAKYNILAKEKPFAVAFRKIQTGFWLRFSLEVFTGKGKLEDYDVLSDVLAESEGEPSWLTFAPEGSFEAVRWAFRDLTSAPGMISAFAKYVGCAVEYSYKDPLTQAMIKKREYKKALQRMMNM